MLIDCYPDPKKFIDNEKRTLKFIYDKKIFKKAMPELFSQLDEYLYHKIMSSQKGVDFETQFEISWDKKELKIHIGAIIESNEDNQYTDLSYYLMICDISRKRILRKFHFDFSAFEKVCRLPHPITHLQYAGELSKYLQTYEYEHDHLESWLSEPRLFYQPMTLALLLNMILNEFRCEEFNNIIERKEWREIVRSNENRILEPFYNRCHHFFSNRKNNLFTSDFCYGNQD